MNTRFKKSPVESPTVRSYREFLGVPTGASEEEIKKAYKRLAMIYHPDRNPGEASEVQFHKVTEAYEALLDGTKIERLNREYLEKKLYDYPIEGINISFGSFFGYRTVSLKRVGREKRIGRERPGEADSEVGIFDLSKSEDSQSILDNPAFDSIELVYAGKFSLGDEARILKGFKGRDLGQLPWIVLNNRGIMDFLEGNFEEALQCYEELNERIPNNIIFLYRLGLCHTILAFQNRKRTLFGAGKPESGHFKKAVDALRKAIAVGESRSIGKQKCLTIRKTLADVFEKAGMLRHSRRVWRDIQLIDPKSAEASLKLAGTMSLSPLKLLSRNKT